jgi:magnesium-transporting ATPase (P-type)
MMEPEFSDDLEADAPDKVPEALSLGDRALHGPVPFSPVGSPLEHFDAKNSSRRTSQDFDTDAAYESDNVQLLDFRNTDGLSSKEAASLLAKYGRNELPEKKIPKWYIFVSQMWEPMPLMIWLAAIVEAAIENFIDAGSTHSPLQILVSLV